MHPYPQNPPLFDLLRISAGSQAKMKKKPQPYSLDRHSLERDSGVVLTIPVAGALSFLWVFHTPTIFQLTSC